MLPAVIHALALLVCLSVQSTSSPLAGTWLFFHFAGCGVLLAEGYPNRKGPPWYLCLAWLLALGGSAFITTPIINACAAMWILTAMPMLAICLREEHLKAYAVCFGTVLTCYAIGLIVQWGLDVRYTTSDVQQGYAWPLLDPNNAAAVINCGLIPAFWLALKRPRYFALAALFAMTLGLTQSKAGMSTAFLGCAMVSGVRLLFIAEVAGIGLILTSPFIDWIWIGAGFINSFQDRLPIWGQSLQLLLVRPFFGLGLGSFGYYYDKVRTEQYTSGYYAHNDLLQLAIETGFPSAIVLVALAVAVALSTRRHNIVAAAVLLGVWLQSMVEFQLYVPAVGLLMGLALACHIHFKAKLPA